MNTTQHWIRISYELSALTQQIAQEHHCNFYQKKLREYIQTAQSDALIYAHQRLKNKRNTDVKRLTYALLELNQSRRVHVIRKTLLDLSPAFSEEVAQLEFQIEKLLVKKKEHRQQFMKLYKYLKKIDATINDGRYELALKLANRCLKEYYRHFLHLKFPSCKELSSEQTNLMSIQVVRYIIKYLEQKGIPYSVSKILAINLFSNTLSFANQPTVLQENKIDKAVAIYTRDNLNLIVRFITRFI